MRYVIIGNSAAGLNGAEAIRRFDRDGQVTIISDEDYPAYSRCLIPYFMEGKITKDHLRYRPEDYYEKHGFQVLLGRRVTKVHSNERTVDLDDGRRLEYDRLLIATGGRPVIPKTPGMDKSNVFGFRTTKDMEGILQSLDRVKQAVVLGGGCVGLMAACGLKAKGVQVVVAIRSPHLLSQIADSKTGEIFRRRLEANGIGVISGVSVKEVTGTKAVEGITFDNGEHIDCQLIVVGKGVRPTIDFLQGSGVATDYGVLVDPCLRTNMPEIYAAGDVAQTTDVISGEKTVNAIWPCAAEQGRIAGMNMTGRTRTYEGSMRMNSAEFFGLPFISIGLVKPPADGYEILARYDAAGEAMRKVVLKQNVLVGVVMVGRISNAGVYGALIRRHIDVSSVKDRLLDADFGYQHIVPLVRQHEDAFSEPEWKHTVLTYKPVSL